MTGTKDGGDKAVRTNKKLYGEDFYAKIGSKGGAAGKGSKKGFAAMTREEHSRISSKGGRKSIRPSKKDVYITYEMQTAPKKSFWKRLLRRK